MCGIHPNVYGSFRSQLLQSGFSCLACLACDGGPARVADALPERALLIQAGEQFHAVLGLYARAEKLK